MSRSFLRENIVLVAGIALPVLLMAGFMVASSLPSRFSDPPRHDLIFAVNEFGPNTSLPISVRLIVKDQVLKAQYTRIAPQPGGYAGAWKKLYRYEAGSQAVRELAFGVPQDIEAITGTREDTVEATADIRLDTSLRSPDGYELTFGDTGRSGLLTGLFWSSYSYEPRLKKGSSSVRLATGDNQPYISVGNIEFIGWVVGTR